MMSWWLCRRVRIKRIDAEAEQLIRDLGDRAYLEARNKQHEASSNSIARSWERVALAVARMTGKRVGLNTTIESLADADFMFDDVTLTRARRGGPCNAMQAKPLRQFRAIGSPKGETGTNSFAPFEGARTRKCDPRARAARWISTRFLERGGAGQEWVSSVTSELRRQVATKSNKTNECLHAGPLELTTKAHEPRTIAGPMRQSLSSALRASDNKELCSGLRLFLKQVAERLDECQNAFAVGSRRNIRLLLQRSSVVLSESDPDRLRNFIRAMNEQRRPSNLTLKESLHELNTLPLLLQSCSLALRALAANRLRSALTTLGIILGVGAVVCMVAVGEGARSQISEQIAKLGTNLLFLQAYDTRHALTEDDAAALRRDVPGVEISAPIIWGAVRAVARDQHLSTTVWGNDSSYLIARDWPLSAGRLFSRDEIASGAKVAVIGQTIAEKLFNGQPRIGATMRLGDVPFTVVGVLEKKGESGSGGDEDNLVVIPLRAARSRVLGSQLGANLVEDPGADSESDPTDESGQQTKKSADEDVSYAHQANYQALDYLVVKYSRSNSEQQVKKTIVDVLQRHHLGSNPMADFGIFDPADALTTQEAAAKSFSWLIAAIASISLLVGGISIMNTMLVSVTERTREIGLRMAVGARRRDIRNQFLVEAVVLAVLGALAGTVLGTVSAMVVARYGGWPVFINPAIVLFACGCTSLVGVVFGSLPAIRASRLDPMVALRTE
jgi:putative ABC transport system permease protein